MWNRSFEGLRTSSTLLKLLNVSTAPFIFTLSALGLIHNLSQKNWVMPRHICTHNMPHYGWCRHPGSMLCIGIRHFHEGVMSCEVSRTRAEEPQSHSPTMPWLLQENAFRCVKSFLCSCILFTFHLHYCTTWWIAVHCPGILPDLMVFLWYPWNYAI